VSRRAFVFLAIVVFVVVFLLVFFAAFRILNDPEGAAAGQIWPLGEFRALGGFGHVGTGSGPSWGF
jgi:hypothetical protein